MKTLAFDAETTGLYPYSGDDMFSFSTCDSEGSADVYRLDGHKLRFLQNSKMLRNLWGNVRIAKVMHNAKFDIEFAEKTIGKSLHGNTVHCTHKMSHILQNLHPSHSLENLTWDLAEYPKIDDEMQAMASQCGGYQNVPERRMHAYQRHDAIRAMLLFRFFYPRITANKKFNDIYNEEISLIWTTIEMEKRGIMVSRPAINRFISDLSDKVDVAKDALYNITGSRFNPGSGEQVANILYKKLGLPVLKKTKKAGEPSTDKHVLMELKEKFPNNNVLDLILQYRSYSKGMSTLREYDNLADSNSILHPSINTCGARTGRESCEHPNLQNVAKSQGLLNPYPIPARKVFRPRPGYINIMIDYSGIEMRLIIHYAREPEMVLCLKSGDGDVHSLAAETFYDDKFINGDASTRKILRDAAKSANFARPYGGGKAKIMLILNLHGKRGLAAVGKYDKRFPKIAGFSNTQKHAVTDNGCVTTEFGRVLHVNRQKPYMGASYLIQGTAAEILKRAQNRVHRYNVKHTSTEVHLLLPIHDELAIEYPRKRIKDLPGYINDIKKLMVDFPMFNVPLDVETSIVTSNWEAKKKYDG